MLKALKNLLLLPVIWAFIILISLLLYTLSHLPKSFSGRYYHYLSRFWCRLFVRALDVDLRRINNNVNPLPEHFILVANHPSALEDFAVPALFDIYPLAKIEVKDWYILGRISDYAGTIYVQREDADSRKMALQSMIDAVRGGKNLVIFPEGGCKGRRIYSSFRAGAFDISIQSGVPILPVFLHYKDQDTFEWTDESLVRKLWQIFLSNKNQVDYIVHDAIYPADFSDKSTFAEHTRQCFLQWEYEYVDALPRQDSP